MLKHLAFAQSGNSIIFPKTNSNQTLNIMRKGVLTLLALLFYIGLQAQDKVYLAIDFMNVSEGQSNAYWETETFWSKIHQERIKSGEILGWDLWSLLPGGEKQQFQYATVQQYNDPAKMMAGMPDLMATIKKAYPNMSEADIRAKLTATSASRSIGARAFLEIINSTKDDFKMKKGMVTTFDMMKVDLESYAAYEKAENDLFKPDHQKVVDNGAKGSWSLARMMLPIGSDTYASHITFNFYTDWKQFTAPGNARATVSPDMEKKINEALKLRDMKYVFLGQLEMMVRP